MRLSLNETHFLFSTALRAKGFPYGTVNAAVRMVQWAQVFHGKGLSFLERRRRVPAPPVDTTAITLRAETATAAAIDAGGQSALLAGPCALDLATARARAHGVGVVSITQVCDLLWLGQLAEQAAGRGLACMITFHAEGDAPEAPLLAELYSSGRSVIAVPMSEAGPLWIEMAATPASHDVLMTSLAGTLSGDFPRQALTPAVQARPGATIVCQTMTPDQGAALGRALREAAGDLARVREPDDVAALHRRAVEDGFEVDDAEYYPLARFGLTTVIPSSGESRYQAGADG